MTDTTRESVEVLAERRKEAITEIEALTECRCHEAYTGRGLHDPMCECDSAWTVPVLRALLSDLDAARTALAAAEAREGELRRVLEPFDKMAGELFARNYDAPDVVLSFEPPEGETVALDFGDFLCVRAALKKGEGQ